MTKTYQVLSGSRKLKLTAATIEEDTINRNAATHSQSLCTNSKFKCYNVS